MRGPLPGAARFAGSGFNPSPIHFKPTVTKSQGMRCDPLDTAIAMNVRLGVDKLNRLQPSSRPRRGGKLKVVGGVDDLKTGALTMVKAKS